MAKKHYIHTPDQQIHHNANNPEHDQQRTERLRYLDYLDKRTIIPYSDPSKDIKSPLLRDPIPALPASLNCLVDTKSGRYTFVSDDVFEKGLKDYVASHCYYNKVEKKKNGSEFIRTVKGKRNSDGTFQGFKPIHKVFYTPPPWINDTLKRCASENPDNLKRGLLSVINTGSEHYSRMTGYTPVTAAVHNDGVIGSRGGVFHIEWGMSQVKDGALVASDGRTIGTGLVLIRNKYPENVLAFKKKYQNARPINIGVMRYVYWSKKYNFGEKDPIYPRDLVLPLSRSIQRSTESNGCLPPDLSLSLRLDTEFHKVLEANPATAMVLKEEMEKHFTYQREYVKRGIGREADLEKRLEKEVANNSLLRAQKEMYEKREVQYVARVEALEGELRDMKLGVREKQREAWDMGYKAGKSEVVMTTKSPESLKVERPSRAPSMSLPSPGIGMDM